VKTKNTLWIDALEDFKVKFIFLIECYIFLFHQYLSTAFFKTNSLIYYIRTFKINLNHKFCEVTPLGASSQELLPDRGESRGWSFPRLGGSNLPHFYLERDLIFLFKFRSKRAVAWVIGGLENVNLERRFNNQDLGTESADVSESAAACPESDSSV